MYSITKQVQRSFSWNIQETRIIIVRQEYIPVISLLPIDTHTHTRAIHILRKKVNRAYTIERSSRSEPRICFSHGVCIWHTRVWLSMHSSFDIILEDRWVTLRCLTASYDFQHAKFSSRTSSSSSSSQDFRYMERDVHKSCVVCMYRIDPPLSFYASYQTTSLFYHFSLYRCIYMTAMILTREQRNSLKMKINILLHLPSIFFWWILLSWCNVSENKRSTRYL